MSLFQRGEYRLHSGERSWWKIDCDNLTGEDFHTLAAIVASWWPQGFGRVVGVPRGGLCLAAALDRYVTPGWNKPVLIVDDVLTTGKSMEEMRERVSPMPCYGAVIFARGQCPAWVRPVFQMQLG